MTLEQKVSAIREAIRAWSATEFIARVVSGAMMGLNGAGGDRARAMFRFVQDNVEHVEVFDDDDLFNPPDRTLYMGRGDCREAVALLGAMLRSEGFPIRLKAVSQGGDLWDHIYIMAGLPRWLPFTWLALDPSTNQPPGWEPAHHFSRLFDVK